MPHNDPIFRQERIELDFKDVALHRSVPSLGRVYTHETNLPWKLILPGQKYPVHKGIHEGIIEVHYIVRGGEQVWQIAGEEYHTRGGDILVTLPGEQHGTGEHTWERMIVYWIQICVHSKDKGGKFLNFPKKFVKPMLDKLSGVQPEARVFKASLQLQHFFDNVILAHAHTDATMKALAVSISLLGLLMEIVRCSQAVPANRKRGEITAVLKYIDEHIADGVEGASLGGEELAGVANLSRSGFHTKFRQQTGMSPAEYVLHRKIKQAEKLLATGLHSVTDVAMVLGFSSSQYFSTVFKKYTNKHPHDYLS